MIQLFTAPLASQGFRVCQQQVMQFLGIDQRETGESIPLDLTSGSATLPNVDGFYRLVIALAQNNGLSTPSHAVTNFEILEDPRNPGTPHSAEECKGKVSSAEAAKAIQ